MDVYIGEDAYQVQKITCVADVSSSLNNKYFVIYEGSNKWLVWYNVGGTGVAPSVTGYTAAPVAISANADASTVATATELVIEALTGLNSTVSGAEITVTATNYGYSIPAHDSQAAKTGFAFELVTVGDTFAKVGLIDGDIEVSALSRNPVDITAHQKGATVLGQIFTGSGNPEMTFNMKEVTKANYEKILRYAAGSFQPVAASSTSVIGGGSQGLFGSPKFVKVVLHPVRLGTADKSADYCFHKCTMDLDSISFSGENILTLPVNVKAFEDETKHPAINVWMYGDWSQTLTA